MLIETWGMKLSQWIWPFWLGYWPRVSEGRTARPFPLGLAVVGLPRGSLRGALAETCREWEDGAGYCEQPGRDDLSDRGVVVSGDVGEGLAVWSSPPWAIGAQEMKAVPSCSQISTIC